MEPALEVSTTTVSFGSASEEKVVYITANNDWTAESNQEWLGLSATSGKASAEQVELVLSAEENVAEEARVAKVTVTSAGITKEISVTQAAVDPKPEEPAEVTVSVEALEAAATAGEYTFTLTANKAWAVTSDAEWAVVDPATGEPTTEAVIVKVTVTENTAEATRTATIKVVAQDAEKTVVLTQAPVVITENGTEAKPWLVKNADDFKAMREKATPGAETYFKMVNDIDMAGVTDYVPVNWDGAFDRKVHFDGGNFTLSNFTCVETGYGEGAGKYPSIFGVFYGTCQNLKVVNAVVEGTSQAIGILGGFVGTTDKPAVVKNVSIKGEVKSTNQRAGAFAGQVVGSTFEACSADVKVSGTQAVAGFAGKATGDCSFTDCEVKAEVTSTAAEKHQAAGFVGYVDGATVTFKSCKVIEGTTITDASGNTALAVSSMGGFLGWAGSSEKIEVTNCSASVTITAEQARNVGGFVGCVGKGMFKISGATVSGTVTAGENSGGFLGYHEGGEIDFTNASTSVAFTGGNYSGGFLGRANGTVKLTDCSATGDVKALSSCSAFAAWFSHTTSATLTRCFATGKFEGNANNGGLVGIVEAGGSGTFVADGCYYKGASMTIGGTGGGLIGYLNGQWTIRNCYVETDIVTKGGNAGGLIGSVVADDLKDEGGAVVATNNTTVDITNCYFKGTVNAGTTSGNYTGGAIGRINGTVKSFNASGISAEGVVKGNQYSGGLIGAAMCNGSQAISNSWSAVTLTITGRKSGGFVGAVTTPMTFTNCYATGDVSGAGQGTGGFLGESNAKVTLTGCYATGNVNSSSTHTGGLVGGATEEIRLSKCYATGNVTATANRAAGLIAYVEKVAVIENCYATGNATTTGQQNGGILGYIPNTGNVTITNCFASGDVGTGRGSAGILGNSQAPAKQTSVVKCIAWNKTVTTSSRTTGNYAPGAVVGSCHNAGTFKQCIRRADMVLNDAANSSILVDQEDVIDAVLPLPTPGLAVYNQSYHGKAAAADATISSVAKSLGWDETIWDLSKDVPTLK